MTTEREETVKRFRKLVETADIEPLYLAGAIAVHQQTKDDIKIDLTDTQVLIIARTNRTHRDSSPPSGLNADAFLDKLFKPTKRRNGQSRKTVFKTGLRSV